MDRLTLFGLFAVTAMLVCYALEERSPWFVLAFAMACALGSAYGFLQGAWPFGLVEAVWAGVAVRRWRLATRPGRPGPVLLLLAFASGLGGGVALAGGGEPTPAEYHALADGLEA